MDMIGETRTFWGTQRDFTGERERVREKGLREGRRLKVSDVGNMVTSFQREKQSLILAPWQCLVMGRDC